MSTKLSDKDEVALIMQQQGVSRVQATKLLYEMTKQKKKEEAAAAAAAALKQDTVLTEDAVVKKHIERYSSMKDIINPAPSMIHEDIDLSAPRPVLKNTSAQDGSNNSGFSSVNLMAASLNSRYQMSTKDTELNGQSIKSNQQDDDEVEETVVPYEEDKFSESIQMLEAGMNDLDSPGGNGRSSQPPRRRSSNSALKLRPLARLHPGKFQRDSMAPGDDSDMEGPQQDEMDYQSGNSSDAEVWEEPGSVQAKPEPVVTAPAPAPVMRAPEMPKPVSPMPSSSLASKLLQPVESSTTDAPRLSPPPPVFAKRTPLSNIKNMEDDEQEVRIEQSNSFRSTSSSSESKTSTIHSARMQPPPVMPRLPTEEKRALLSSGRENGASSPVPAGSSMPSPVPVIAPTASAESSQKLPSPPSTARANEVLNVQVGKKKLTVRSSFTGSSGGNAGSAASALAAASAAASSTTSAGVHADTSPPPPEYNSPPPAYGTSPPKYASRPIPPVPQAPVSLSPGTSRESMSAKSANNEEPVPMPASTVLSAPSPKSVLKRPSLSSVDKEIMPLSDVEEESGDGSDEDDLTPEERVAAMMAKYRRRSYMKKDNTPEAFKGLSPIEEDEIGRLMYLEQQRARETSATAQAVSQSIVSNTTTTSAVSSEPVVLSEIVEVEIAAKPEAKSVAAVMNKRSTDLVEELISQGYSRENALSLAKEIEMDRMGERFRTHHAHNAQPDSSQYHHRTGASVASHSSSINHYSGRERPSFDRSFNDDDTSVISGISGVSRASSYCESDKLLMNLLLSQQKGKFGVNMYESLSNEDEPVIERYMSKGCTLDQAVLKVFERKFGSVESQALPKSMYGVDSAAKNALNAPDSLEIVDTMHAEIELLMLSGGYSRDVAVKMLLSKVAKEKALQQQSGGGFLSGGGGGGGGEEHHLHKAASMSSMLPGRHLAEPEPRVSSRDREMSSSHSHSLHSSRSMYAMPSSGGSVGGGSVSSNGRSSRSRSEQQYSQHGAPPHMPPDASSFPSQYAPHSSRTHRRRGSEDEHSRRRPSGSASVTSGIASVHSRGTVNTSTTAGSRTQDDREFIPALLREQEARYGVHMYDYLAPDNPEVMRLMSEFHFSQTDAMIAVFQQFPPPPQPKSSGSTRSRGVAEPSRQPAFSPLPSPVGGGSRGPPPPQAAAVRNKSYDEEEELQRVMRLSMMEQNNHPGVVVVPGTGASRAGGNGNGRPVASNGATMPSPRNADVTTLMHMGFTSAQAHDALIRHNNNVEMAANYLVGGV
eukprot:CAMPEP_0170422576 /NCGR_PEP_ID=MMETSP0117_2-20130122/36526_1 /TAXON_ID=400756 /ORGANISM="Durinskia baltica, Strain CSIRO CS-38" /LENGTH=1270 /DNA_ID=CAMNT_0010681243 /DNA_START=119 /DNA_END=3931 /DNA_ORIENTATION=-